jgi:thermostable 8-oxoguanine DNA glycosylase
MAAGHREDDELPIVEKSDGTVEVDSSKIEQPGDDQHEGEEGESNHVPDDGGVDQASDTEEIRRIRREKRKARKQMHVQERAEKDFKYEQLKRENAQLLTRLSAVEQRTNAADQVRVDKALEDEMVRLEYAEMEINKATRSGDGDAMIGAQRMLHSARVNVDKLANLKRQATEASKQPQQTQDPVVAEMAGKWMRENSWYDPNVGDQDSAIAVAVDKVLLKEGFNPRTEKYWEEFTNRLKKTLPEHYSGDDDSSEGVVRERPRSMNESSGREANSGSSTKATFTLSADRVRALKEAGMYDNVQVRNKMIRRYIDSDRKAGR